MRIRSLTRVCVVLWVWLLCPPAVAQDEAAEEARRIVAKHADALDGEAKRLKPKNESAAEVLSRAAQALRTQLDRSKESASGEASTPYVPDLGLGADPGIGIRPRSRPSQPAKAAVVSAVEFARTYAAGYPREANLARAGRATASSTHGEMEDPITALGGVRRRDTWALRGGKGWFLAEWAEPLPGRYVLLFNRPAGGGDAWEGAAVEINGRPAAEFGTFTRGQVLVLDLGEPVAIKTVKINITGTDNPGLAGLEIHRATGGAKRR